MSLKFKPKIFNTITFRLTLSYAAFFLISSLILSGVIYYKLAEYTNEQLHKRMLEQLHELEELLQDQGIETVQNDMKTVTKTSKYNLRFFRIFNSKNILIQEFINPKWKTPGIDKSSLQTAMAGKDIFKTVKIPDHEYPGHVLYASLGKQFKVQIGFTSRREMIQLKKIRFTFIEIIFLGLLPFSILSSWFMAVYATKDLRKMTDIATAIKNGDFSLRMPEVKSKREINLLANAFNNMLNTLDIIMKENRESTDHIAHDLRSPLTSICGNIEVVIAKPRSSDEYVEVLQSTIEDIYQLQAMINTLLDISSMESNVLSGMKPVNIKTLLENVIDIFQYAIDQKNIKLSISCENDIVIPLNELYMKRALSNLLDNAIKYTPENGSVSFDVKMVNNNLTITLSDNGIGIDEEDIPRLFDRFYRGDKSRSTPGSGLGLSFVKSVINAHKGTVTVSTPSSGTTFTISIRNQ